MSDRTSLHAASIHSGSAIAHTHPTNIPNHPAPTHDHTALDADYSATAPDHAASIPIPTALTHDHTALDADRPASIPDHICKIFTTSGEFVLFGVMVITKFH